MSGWISILLVEDNADDADIIRRLLRRSGGDYRVEHAATGHEALEKAQSGTWDVSLVDQQLPDTTGEQLIGALREVAPALPVIMLTRQGDERLAVEVMKAGAYDYLRKDDLDSAVLHRTVRNVVERSRLEREIERANERLRDWAIRDGLTGLFNHRHFQELLRTEFARSKRYGQVLACLMVDLDHFKLVNDTYGHPFGDVVLGHVSRTLVAEARKVDILARYGGEEFVLILPSTDRAGARIVAERICERVGRTPITHEGVSVAVTLSVGVATSDDPRCLDENALVKFADAALYRAKRAGRNRVCVEGDARPGGLSEAVSLTPVSTAVREYEGDVRRLSLASLRALVALAERNDGFEGHSERVSNLSVLIGRALGLDASDLDALQCGGLLHDVGRLAASDPLWTRAEALTVAERARLPRHCQDGVEILAQAPWMERERLIVRHHHERWDGQGYPSGLAGERIPLLARIVALADTWDALTSSRPWRPAFEPTEALALMNSERGIRFDPSIQEAFSRVLRESRRE